MNIIEAINLVKKGRKVYHTSNKDVVYNKLEKNTFYLISDYPAQYKETFEFGSLIIDGWEEKNEKTQ